MTCSVCEQVGELSDGAGELLLAPASGHPFGRVRQRLESKLGAEWLRHDGVMSWALALPSRAFSAGRAGGDLCCVGSAC